MIAEDRTSSGEMEIVTFGLGKEYYGLNIMEVQEIIRTPDITAVPQAPPYVEGITNLRGSILPVISTRIKFGMEPQEKSINNRVIVVEVAGRMVGLTVDAVSEVLRISSDRIEKAPHGVENAGDGLITGVVKDKEGKRLVMLLDTGKLCSIETMGQAGSERLKSTSQSAKADKVVEEIKVVTFILGDEEFGLEIKQVNEIIRYPDVVKVPNVPEYVKGVISLRDDLLPIIDLRIKLATGNPDITDRTRVVVADVHGTRAGLVVDRVCEVMSLPVDAIYPPPQALTGDAREKIKGIARLDDGRRIIMLIEPDSIVSQDDLGAVETESRSSDSSGNQGVKSYAENVNEKQMVVFRLAGEEYGVDINQVQEINRLAGITKVPRAPKFVEGVVNLRGEVIPVIDLRKRLEMEARAYNERTRIIVSEIQRRKIGIIVDEVVEVLRVSRNIIEEAPGVITGKETERFLEGIANLKERIILLLNLEELLAEKEWQKLQEMSSKEAGPKKAGSSKLKKQEWDEE